MTKRLEKQSHTTLRVALLISSITECLRSGDIESVNFSCKYTTPSLSNIRKDKRTKSYRLSYEVYDRQSLLVVGESLRFRMA